MLISPSGVTMREMIDGWKDYKNILTEEEKNKDKVMSVLGGDDFIMFFNCDDKTYGAPEMSRMTYAILVNPGKEDNGIEDMNFGATDLQELIGGKTLERMFSHKDLPKIKIVSKSQALKNLLKEKPAKEIDLPAAKNVGGNGTIIQLKQDGV